MTGRMSVRAAVCETRELSVERRYLSLKFPRDCRRTSVCVELKHVHAGRWVKNLENLYARLAVCLVVTRESYIPLRTGPGKIEVALCRVTVCDS